MNIKPTNFPIMAILRGLQPEDAQAVGELVYQFGIKQIEVPLNRANALLAIEQLINHLPDDCLIGAGTVTKVDQVNKLSQIGAKLVVSPHFDEEIVTATLNHNLVSIPGVATVTEAYAAIKFGAKWLKLFPANTYGCKHLSAMKSVLPPEIKILAVGGIDEINAQHWLDAGASALGIGSHLYQAGNDVKILTEKLIKLTGTSSSLYKDRI